MTYDLLVDYTYGGIHLSRDYLDLTKEELDDYIMWYRETYRILNMEVYEND